MQRSEFIDLVQRRGDFESNAEAEAAAVATLSTLSERLSHGQAQDLAGELSDELAGPLTTAGEQGATDLTAEEFVDRVGERLDEEGADVDAERGVQAVLGSLSGAAGEEWQGIVAQLPDGYERFYDT